MGHVRDSWQADVAALAGVMLLTAAASAVANRWFPSPSAELWWGCLGVATLVYFKRRRQGHTAWTAAGESIGVAAVLAGSLMAVDALLP